MMYSIYTRYRDDPALHAIASFEQPLHKIEAVVKTWRDELAAMDDNLLSVVVKDEDGNIVSILVIREEVA